MIHKSTHFTIVGGRGGGWGRCVFFWIVVFGITCFGVCGFCCCGLLCGCACCCLLWLFVELLALWAVCGAVVVAVVVVML